MLLHKIGRRFSVVGKLNTCYLHKKELSSKHHIFSSMFVHKCAALSNLFLNVFPCLQRPEVHDGSWVFGRNRDLRNYFTARASIAFLNTLAVWRHLDENHGGNKQGKEKKRKKVGKMRNS